MSYLPDSVLAAIEPARENRHEFQARNQDTRKGMGLKQIGRANGDAPSSGVADGPR